MDITDFLRTDICDFYTINRGKTWNCKVCKKLNMTEKKCPAETIIEKENKNG